MVAVVLAGLIAVAVSGFDRVHADGPCGPPIVNPVACENTATGTQPLDWDVGGAGDPTIQGFSTDISVNVGDTVRFKIKTDASSYHFDIFRLGYYSGAGARRMAFNLHPSVSLPQSQPACKLDDPTGLVDCGNWTESASWAVPSTAVSGVYIAHLIRDDNGGDSHIMFIVRNDASHSDILYQTSDSTWTAYNAYGGNSLYTGSPVGRAYKVSYNRPNILRGDGNFHRTNFFADEFPMVRWLEANGYDVSYTTDLDSDRRGSLITQHRVFLSSGHDEYWSAGQRNNVEAAGAAGVNLAFFSGNEVFWKTRWEPSIDPSATPNRTLVTYKETAAGAPIDPQDPPTWTGTWRDPRFSPPADGGRPENALTGTAFMVNCCWSGPITVPSADGKMRFWRNTSVATLPPGQSATLTDGVLGYEWDEAPDNASRPAGEFVVSTTTASVPQKLIDYGSTYAPGTATHNLTIHRLSSGALVFGAGTVRWSWGLDATHDDGSSSPDQRMQQATVNLLADMSAQPATMMAGLTAATRSTDVTPPTSTITSPSQGATLPNGSTVTITGTAGDTGGGVVAGVDVSTDGGTTWHPASGRESWSYTWSVNTMGTVTIKSRAVDDSGNIETPSAGRSVVAVCPCMLWGNGITPAVAAESDSGPLELGVKFRAEVGGYVSGVRFYKGAGNGGTHVVNLWDTNGNLLDTATSTPASETPTGWQSVTFPTPYNITANTTYLASYFAPQGHYAYDTNYFTNSGRDSPPLHALKAGVDGPNGVFKYNGSSTYPSSFASSNANYWVDLLLSASTESTPPIVVGTVPPNGATGVDIAVAPSATYSKPVQPATVSFTLKDSAQNPVAGVLSYNSGTNTSIFTPSSALASNTTYAATVSGAIDLGGHPMGAPYMWSFTTLNCPCQIWPGSTTPTNTAVSDTGSVELGVRFRSDAGGSISAIRFYKGTGNDGPHVGNLWSNTGTLMSSATFGSESPTGWQQATFPSPVPIAANTTYVASYFAPHGHYSFDGGYFSSTGRDSPPLHALRSGIDGSDGSFKYGSQSAFPSDPGNGANYWVDVVFTATVDSTPPTVTSTQPAGGATQIPVTVAPRATFSKPVQPATVVFTLKDAQNNPVAGAVSYNAGTLSATFTPNAALGYGQSYTATVSGATDLSGHQMTAPFTWSFTTLACPCQLWPAGTTPGNPESGDGGAVELGLKFRSDVSGYVTGVRFYKGSQNNGGTHIGNLWSTGGGSPLASVQFSGETPSGWQQANFLTPVAISANTTYVISYFAPQGHYAFDGGYFASQARDNPPLHGLMAGTDGPNAVYRYSGTSTYPSDPGGGSPNYWVDAVFATQVTPDNTPPAVTGTAPANGATGVGIGAAPTATFSKPVQPATISFLLRDPQSNPVAGSVAYNAATATATFTPSAPLRYGKTYTATVSGARDLNGIQMTGPYVWSFTTTGCPCSLWSTSTVPGTAAVSDPGGVEVGVKFRSDVNGVVTGVRFYKGPGNAGTHIGNLWSTSGQLLASVPFSSETPSGWQQVNFTTPVAVTANTTYIVSYYAPQGHYAYDFGYFASQNRDNPPLHGLRAGGLDGADGVFKYGTSSAFPSDFNNNTNANYWVDVVFNTT